MKVWSLSGWLNEKWKVPFEVVSSLESFVRSTICLFVALLFAVIMMVATAQQQALASFKENEISMSYSLALKQIEQISTKEKELEKLQEQAKEIIKNYRNSSEENASPRQNSNPNSEVVSSDADIADLEETLNELEIATLEDEITRRADRLAFLKKIEDNLQEMNVLKEMFVNKFMDLTKIPSSIMPMFVTFVSGLFGSVLVYLIRTVYSPPESQPVKQTEDDKKNKAKRDVDKMSHLVALEEAGSNRFLRRTFLGGFIALAVYVVLGSGAAVFASHDAPFDGESNVMTLALIGLLSGMYSYRVARWLDIQLKIFDPIS